MTTHHICMKTAQPENCRALGLKWVQDITIYYVPCVVYQRDDTPVDMRYYIINPAYISPWEA